MSSQWLYPRWLHTSLHWNSPQAIKHKQRSSGAGKEIHIGMVYSIDLHLSGFLRLLSTEPPRSTGLSLHFYDLCLKTGRRAFAIIINSHQGIVDWELKTTKLPRVGAFEESVQIISGE